MLDSATRGLYIGSPDRTLYVSYNAYTPVRDEVEWRAVHLFSHQPIPLAVGSGPNGAALYVSLNDYNGDTRVAGPHAAQRRWRQDLDAVGHPPGAR